jgi:adenylate kinase family enzyme
MLRFFRVNVIGEAGAGKSTLATKLAEQGFELFRPSDVIRAFAERESIPLSKRQDYVDLHRKMVAEDPYAMIRPLLERDVEGLVIDGLRVQALAQLLERDFGMHTIALDKPSTMTEEAWANMRHERIRGASHLRTYRDRSIIGHLADFRADEQADRVDGSDFEPHIPNVMAMAGVRGIVIDASLPPEKVLTQAQEYVARQTS